MIVGGTVTSGSSKKAHKTYLRMVQNVYNPIIGFLEEDARNLHHPHDDALIVSLRVGDYSTHRVLVDNRSFADILYYLAF